MDHPYTAVPLPARLTVTTTPRGGVGVLTPVGDLDADTAATLAAALIEAGSPVVADLSRVEFLGCAGIRALFDASALTVVCTDGSPVRRTLAVTGADQVLTVHPTVTAALAAAVAR